MFRKRRFIYSFLIFVVLTFVITMTYVLLAMKKTGFARRVISVKNEVLKEDEVDGKIIKKEEIIAKEIESEIVKIKEDDKTEENTDVIKTIEIAKDALDEIAKYNNKKVEVVDPYAALPEYVPVKRSSDEIKIGFITDLHVRSYINDNGIRIPNDLFINRINCFVEKMNNEVVPDFMLVNGDVIEGSGGSKIGMEELRSVKSLFDRSKIQKYWVIGNHDLRSVTKKQWKNALGVNYLRNSFDSGDYKVIILDSNFTREDEDVIPGNGHKNGKVSEEEIKWLKKELETDKKKIVFMHHSPLWNVSFKPNDGLPDNSEELRSIFSEYGVLAVISGHIEELYYEKVNGVSYFVVPGIFKHLKYEGAFSIIDIKNDRVEIEVNYFDNKGQHKTARLNNK